MIIKILAWHMQSLLKNFITFNKYITSLQFCVRHKIKTFELLSISNKYSYTLCELSNYSSRKESAKGSELLGTGQDIVAVTSSSTNYILYFIHF